MKAIETNYNGYRFRSRLEARWAVFFDALGIKWEYELEGYQLSDGSRYLPDFFLPKFHGDLFVEVKPFDVPTSELKKSTLFAAEAHAHLLLAIGVPANRPYMLLGEEMALWESSVAFCSKYLPGGRNADEYRLYWQAENFVDFGIIHAIVAARSARFEFGESP